MGLWLFFMQTFPCSFRIPGPPITVSPTSSIPQTPALSKSLSNTCGTMPVLRKMKTSPPRQRQQWHGVVSAGGSVCAFGSGFDFNRPFWRTGPNCCQHTPRETLNDGSEFIANIKYFWWKRQNYTHLQKFAFSSAKHRGFILGQLNKEKDDLETFAPHKLKTDGSILFWSTPVWENWKTQQSNMVWKVKDYWSRTLMWHGQNWCGSIQVSPHSFKEVRVLKRHAPKFFPMVSIKRVTSCASEFCSVISVIHQD